MIKRLSIKNYAIIDKVEIEFSKGLTIITGETGAGKSILLGALGLIMGDRAETRVLYNAEKKCVIEAYFDILHYDLRDLFEELDLDYDTEVIVRREITPSGKSRAFVNDTPIRLNNLRILSAKLVDLHRQFDTLDIHKEEFQLQMIDALANHKPLLEQYQKHYKSYQSNKRKLEKLIIASAKAANELDFFEFQLDELSKAELEEEEQETLEVELATLTNAEEIKRNLGAVFQHLSESEQSIVSQLQGLLNSVASVQQFNKKIGKTQERLEGLVYELEDVAGVFEDIAESTEYNPKRIAEVQERLDLIYKLQTKHHVADIAGLLAKQADLELKVESVADMTEEIEKLEAVIDKEEHKLQKIAKQLSKNRKSKAPSFEKKIKSMLSDLAMPHAQIKVDIKSLTELSATGLDALTFLFSANKGGRMDTIKNVASGGELSRLTLCTKALVANAIPLPTLIFDEIDTGVSGDVAGRIGNILRTLSDEHQVVTITHTPQIAAKSDYHYFVYKKVVKNKTVTNVKLLNREERVNEIAIMLSGNPPSDYAVSNAVDLLER